MSAVENVLDSMSFKLNILCFLYRIALPVLSIGIALYLTYAIVESMEQLQSVLGLIFFIAIAWLFSKHPDDVSIF